MPQMALLFKQIDYFRHHFLVNGVKVFVQTTALLLVMGRRMGEQGEYGGADRSRYRLNNLMKESRLKKEM